jgi:hypothetical protein
MSGQQWIHAIVASAVAVNLQHCEATADLADRDNAGRYARASSMIRITCNTPLALQPALPSGTSGRNRSYSRNPTRFSSSGGSDAARYSLAVRTSGNLFRTVQSRYDCTRLADAGLPSSSARSVPPGAGSTGISRPESRTVSRRVNRRTTLGFSAPREVGRAGELTGQGHPCRSRRLS